MPLFSSARARRFSWVMLFVVGILTMGLLWLIPWAWAEHRRPIPVGVPVGKTVVIVPPPVPAHDTVLDHHHDTVLVNGNGAAKTNGIESPGVNGGPHQGTLERNGATRGRNRARKWRCRKWWNESEEHDRSEARGFPPLSPVLGGEGLGVRGSDAVGADIPVSPAGRLKACPTPSPPTPLPRVQGRGE